AMRLRVEILGSLMVEPEANTLEERLQPQNNARKVAARRGTHNDSVAEGSLFPPHCSLGRREREDCTEK
ncbi:MAG: hypothetical protein WBY38_16735, partial [Candidatus Acidiferrales bacterium]